MSCQHLVCAACAGVVADGRCPTCRAARLHVHERTGLTLSPQLVALVLALLLALAVAGAHLAA